MVKPALNNSPPSLTDVRELLRKIPVRVECRPTVDDVEAMRGFIRRTGIRAWVASAVGANRRPEHYGSPLYRSHVPGFDLHPDADPEYLPRLVRMAREEHVVLLSWFPLTHVWVGAHDHPEWRIRYLPEGEGPKDDTCCLLSTGYLDFVIAISQEIVTVAGFDGLWFDGTANIAMYGAEPGAWGCACEGCRDKFRRDTGLTFPGRWNWHDSAFRSFIRWSDTRKKQVLQAVARAVYDARPGACVAFNHSGAGPMPNGGRFNDWRINLPLDDDETDTIHGNEATEGLSPVLYARIGASLSRGDFDVWRPFSHAGLPWNGGLEPPREEVLSHAFSQIAHGGAAFFGMPRFTGNYARVLEEVIHESDRREPWRGGSPVNHLAIHLSQAARDFGGRDDPARYLKNWLGAYELAAGCGLPLGIVSDSQLTAEHLDKYRVLYLPESTCLSDEQIHEIQVFVHGGGTLIATGQTAVANQEGQTRSVPALDGLFGIERSPGGSTRWMIVGPFDNPESKGFDTPYGPELGAIDLSAEYKGAGGRTMRWKTYDALGGFVNFLEQFSPNEWVCAYAYSEVDSPDDQDVIFAIGSDDGIKVWLNAELVHQMFRLRGVYQEQDVVRVRLRKGKNRILIKVEQRYWDWGFILQILEPGQPIRPFKAAANLVCAADERLRAATGPWVWMGANPMAFQMSPNSQACVLARQANEQISEQDLDFTDPQSCASGIPAVSARKFGCGQAIYINTNLGEAQLRYPGLNFADLFKCLASRDGFSVKIDGPAGVEVSAFWKDNRLVCHLLNRPFTSARPLLPEACRPVLHGRPLRADVTLTVCTEKSPGRAYLPLEGRTLPIQAVPGLTECVTVRTDVELHQIIVFEGIKLRGKVNEDS